MEFPAVLGVFLIHSRRCSRVSCEPQITTKGHSRRRFREEQSVTLPALQKNFVNIFFVFAGEFCIEKWRGFLVNFLWSRSPTKRSTRVLEKFGENSEQNSGQNSGRKFEKFGKLSFCDLPNLRKSKRGVKTYRAISFGGGGENVLPVVAEIITELIHFEPEICIRNGN